MHQFIPIKDYPGYAICACGLVQGTRGKLLKLRKTIHGYPYVSLRGEFKVVHRLVAQTFIPNPEHKEQVNHIDGNKTNNNLSNLEWCTRSENQLHAFRTGLQGSPTGHVGNKSQSTYSKYHNVGYEPKRKKWTARVRIKGKAKTFRFDSEEEAALKVNEIIDEFNLDRPKNVV